MIASKNFPPKVSQKNNGSAVVAIIIGIVTLISAIGFIANPLVFTNRASSDIQDVDNIVDIAQELFTEEIDSPIPSEIPSETPIPPTPTCPAGSVGGSNDPGGGGGNPGVPICVTITPEPSLTLTPEPSLTLTLTPTLSPTTTLTPTLSPTETLTPTLSPTTTLTPTLSPTETLTPTLSPTTTLTPTLSPTETLTPTLSPTTTLTPTLSPTETLTPTLSPTTTLTPTLSPTETLTPTLSPTTTLTPTLSPTETLTPSKIPTPTFTPIPTATILPLKIPTLTMNPTFTPSPMPLICPQVKASILNQCLEGNFGSTSCKWTVDQTGIFQFKISLTDSAGNLIKTANVLSQIYDISVSSRINFTSIPRNALQTGVKCEVIPTKIYSSMKWTNCQSNSLQNLPELTASDICKAISPTNLPSLTPAITAPPDICVLEKNGERFTGESVSIPGVGELIRFSVLPNTFFEKIRNQSNTDDTYEKLLAIAPQFFAKTVAQGLVNHLNSPNITRSKSNSYQPIPARNLTQLQNRYRENMIETNISDPRKYYKNILTDFVLLGTLYAPSSSVSTEVKIATAKLVVADVLAGNLEQLASSISVLPSITPLQMSNTISKRYNNKYRNSISGFKIIGNCSYVTGMSPKVYVYQYRDDKEISIDLDHDYFTYVDKKLPIIAKGRVSELYYEYIGQFFEKPTNGWVVKKSEIPEFVKNISSSLNLFDHETHTLQTELNQAIQAIKDGSIFISLIDENTINRWLPIESIPKVKNMKRLMFYLGSADRKPLFQPFLPPVIRSENQILEIGVYVGR